MEYRVKMAAARVNAGLTQEDVAKQMKVSKNTIVNWETGKIEPKPAQFYMYCEICEAPPEVVDFVKA